MKLGKRALAMVMAMAMCFTCSFNSVNEVYAASLDGTPVETTDETTDETTVYSDEVTIEEGTELDEDDECLNENSLEEETNEEGYSITLSIVTNGRLMFYDKELNTVLEDSSKKYNAGDTVEVHFIANEGYKVKKLVIEDTKGNELYVGETEDDVFEFTMPNADLVIKGQTISDNASEENEDEGEGKIYKFINKTKDDYSIELEGKFADGAEYPIYAGDNLYYDDYMTCWFSTDSRVSDNGKGYANAFCVEPPKGTPTQGTSYRAQLVTDQRTRDVMYYCYGQPGYNGNKALIREHFINATAWSDYDEDTRVYIGSHLAMSYMISGESVANIGTGEGNAKNCATQILSFIYDNKVLPPAPDNYKVYLLNPIGNTTVQKIILAEMEKNGFPFSIQKNGNDIAVNTASYSNGQRTNTSQTTLGAIRNKYSASYGSLDDARFTMYQAGTNTAVDVYTNKECTVKATNGQLAAGTTYYVKTQGNYKLVETTVPKGWSKTSQDNIAINSATTKVIILEDFFDGDPLTLTIQKEGKADNPLAGAEFTLKNTDTNESWVFKSNEQGRIAFSNPAFLKEGTAYLANNGSIHFYIGNYTITETKAPTGYATSGEFVTNNGKSGSFNGTICSFSVVDSGLGDGTSKANVKTIGVTNVTNTSGEGLQINLSENPKMMGFKVQKRNNDTKDTVLEGSMANYTTNFEVYYVGRKDDTDDSNTWVDYNLNGKVDAGEKVAKGSKIKSKEGSTTWTTNTNGYYEVSGNYMQAGTYRIVEVAPPRGMIRESALDKTEIYFPDSSNTRANATDWKSINSGTIIDLSSANNSLVNSLIRGGVAGYKYNAATLDTTAVDGGSFDGIEFYVRNDNANAVWLDVDGDGVINTTNGIDKLLNPNGEYLIAKLSNGSVEFSTNPTLLPYGSYSLLEKQGSNTDYIVENKYSTNGIKFTISNDLDYKLFVLNKDTDKIQSRVNNLYSTLINSLKTHNSDGTSGNTKRTVKFANIGNDANSVFANNSARHGLAIIKYDADDYNSAKASMQVANGSYPEPQGDATLVGATYEIYNRNNYAVMVDTNNDHKGDTKVEANGLCTTITTVVDTTSNIEYALTNNTLLPNGTYEIVEKTPPVGYLKTTNRASGNNGIVSHRYTATADGQYFLFGSSDEAINKLKDVVTRNSAKTTFGTHTHSRTWVSNKTDAFTNPVERGKLVIKKNDADMKAHSKDGVIALESSDYGSVSNDNESKYAQGDASFNSAVYEVYNISNHYVYTTGTNNGTSLNKYLSGKATFKTLTGIDVDSLSYTNGVYDAFISNAITDDVASKIRTQMADNVCYTLTTDSYGNASTNADALPYGTYLVLEKTPSKGYLNSVKNGGENAKIFRIRKEAETVSLTYDVDDITKGLFEPVVRGGFEVYKFDEETRMNVPLGTATLEGTFEVINRSKDYVWVDSNEDGTFQDSECYAPNTVVFRFKTDEKTGAYKSATNLLPYGTYEIHEVYPPYGYLHLSNINPNMSVFFEIREEGKIVSEGWFFDKDGTKVTTHKHYEPILDAFNEKGERVDNSALASKLNEVTDARLVIYNFVVRGDIVFKKKSGITMEKMAYIPFLLTSYDAKGNAIESHIIFTDKNGTYNSSSLYVDHTYNTNSGDEMKEWLAEYEEAFKSNDKAKLETLDNEYAKLVEKYGNGVGTWFGLNTTVVDDLNRTGTMSNPLNVTGAMPFGTYTIEELRCPYNKDYEMVKDTIVLDVDAASTDATVDPDGYKSHIMHSTVDLGTIYNTYKGLSTVALTQSEQSHYSYPYSNLVIIDEVQFENLIPHRNYKLVAELHDVKTGAILKDDWGKDVRVEKEFSPSVGTGSTDMRLEFDAYDYKNGGSVVVFEYLYDLEENSDEPIMYEDDVENSDQQIHFSMLDTNMLDNKTNSHISKAEKEMEYVDEIVYDNLEIGATYLIDGYLIDKASIDYAKDDNGKNIVASIYEEDDTITYNKEGKIIFKPKEKEGVLKIAYRFDGEKLAGHTLVSFVEIKKSNVTIAKHMDIDSESQTIYVPLVKTSAYDKNTGLKMSFANSAITINDEISYSNILPNTEYSLVGTLIDKATGEVVKDSNGKVVTATKSFTSTSTSGTVTVSFEFDGRGLEGHTLVAYAKLYKGDYEIADHSDITDVEETIYIPKVGTVATDSKNATHMVNPDGSISITDTVDVWNLIPNLKYQLVGTLIDLDTKEPLLDKDGNVVTATSEFSPNVADSKQKIVFEFKGYADLKGKTTVAFEDLYVLNDVEGSDEKKPVKVGEERNLESKEQTIYFPEIHTTAFDGTIGINMSKAGKGQIIDTVSYYNLEPNREFTVKGRLVDKETGKTLTVKGKDVVSSATFTSTESGFGTVDVVFDVDTTGLEGKTLVAYENLYLDEFLLETHEDLEDEAETIFIPKIGTLALDSETKDHIALADEEVTITDVIEYSNLNCDYSYFIVGQMINKDTKQPIPLLNGTDFDASKLEHPYKADIIFSDRVKDANIGDIDDSDLKTDLDDEEFEVIEDDTEIVEVDGKYYVVKEFKPIEPNGEVEMEFVFNASELGLSDNCTVAYEELFVNGYSVAEHKDIESDSQTITFPSVHTTALNTADNTHFAASEGIVEIEDEVFYSGLLVGKEYSVSGFLVNKLTGEKVTVLNKETNEREVVTNEITFVAEKSSGSIKLKFSFDASEYIGAPIVAMETLKYKGVDIAIHADINDEEQTVRVVEIKTKGLDKNTKTHSLKKGKTTIVDEISFKGLKPNEEYVLVGKLMDKNTNKPLVKKSNLLDNLLGENNEYITELKFTPNTTEGTVFVEFEVDTKDLDTNALVVFEKLYHNGKNIANHEDITSESQTLIIPSVGTQAIDSETKDHIALADEEVTIIDTVKLTNVNPNETYVLVGQLIDKRTNKPIYLSNGTDYKKKEDSETATSTDATSSDATSATDSDAKKEENTDKNNSKVGGYYVVKTITPTEANTDVDITFICNATDLAGASTVVFEELYSVNGVLIAEHKDINSKEQTIDFPSVHTTALNKENGTHFAEAKKEIIVEDEVFYSNLHLDKEYTVTGILMNKETGKPIYVTNSETGKREKATASLTFICKQTTGSVKLQFKLDATEYVGVPMVAYETLKYKGIDIGIHADINDEDQTVRVVQLKTSAIDGNTKKHMTANGKTVLIDTVSYKGLKPNENFKISGKLMDKETGKPLTKDGKEYVSEVTFVPAKSDGTVELRYEIDTSDLAGKTIVVFEKLYSVADNKNIANHEDINDIDQTLVVPKVGTKNIDKATGTKNVTIGSQTVLVDEIKYEGLEPNVEYTIEGKLVKKSDGKPVTTITKAESKTESKTDTKADANTTAEMEIDGIKVVMPNTIGCHNNTDNRVKATCSLAKSKDGKSLVMGVDMEVVKWTTPRNNWGAYVDILDADGKAIVDSKFIYFAKADIKVGDKFSNEIVIPLETKKIVFNPNFEGTSADSKTETKTSESEVVSKVTFTPTESSGTVKMEFVIDTTKYAELAGETLVAYEYLNYMDVRVAKHEDINSAEQSVYVVKVNTKATVNGKKIAQKSEKTEVIDTLTYENAIAGQEYTIKGVLMDKSTNTPTGATAEVKFVAKDTKGTVEVKFSVDTTKYDSLVVFEEMYIGDKLIAYHKDLSSEDQTVTFTKDSPPTEVRTGANMMVYVLIALMFVFGGMGIVFLKRRKIQK